MTFTGITEWDQFIQCIVDDLTNYIPFKKIDDIFKI